MKLGEIYTFFSVLLVLIFLLLRMFGMPKKGASKIAESVMIGAILALILGLIVVTIIYS